MEPPPFRDIRSSSFYILMQLMSMMTIFIVVFEESLKFSLTYPIFLTNSLESLDSQEAGRS